MPGTYDNSNTQFGVLGLWVARRQKVPVQAGLVQADRHFRGKQQANGSWKYDDGDSLSSVSMTCAGLMTLAMGHAIRPGEDRKPAKDAGLEKGFTFLAGYIGRGAKKPFDLGQALGPGIDAKNMGGADFLEGFGEHLSLYYLWSVERVAVIYDLKTISGKDWYTWAAEAIIKDQQADGSWKDAKLHFLIDGPVNTCFALLVLKRSNVVPDLTVEVKKAVNLKDIEVSTEK
jgi:hypothetical protein